MSVPCVRSARYSVTSTIQSTDHCEIGPEETTACAIEEVIRRVQFNGHRWCCAGAGKSADFANEMSLKRVRRDKWVPDRAAPVCFLCKSMFGFRVRRHHCRLCGQVVCSAWSSNRLKIQSLDMKRKSRVCDRCFEQYAPSWLQKDPSRRRDDRASFVRSEERPDAPLLGRNRRRDESPQRECCCCCIL